MVRWKALIGPCCYQGIGRGEGYDPGSALFRFMDFLLSRETPAEDDIGNGAPDGGSEVHLVVRGDGDEIHGKGFIRKVFGPSDLVGKESRLHISGRQTAEGAGIRHGSDERGVRNPAHGPGDDRHIRAQKILAFHPQRIERRHCLALDTKIYYTPCVQTVRALPT